MKKFFLFTVINLFILILIFILTPLISGFINSVVIFLICRTSECGLSTLLVSGLVYWSMTFFVVLTGIVLIFILGMRFIVSKKVRFIYYFSIFSLITFIFVLPYIVYGQLTKQVALLEEKINNSIKLLSITENLKPSASCSNPILELKLDLNVKYDGDYSIGARYIKIAENMPSLEGGSIATTANGKYIESFCDNNYADNTGRCKGWLNLVSGKNTLVLDFPDFIPKIRTLQKLGRFPLDAFTINMAQVRKKGLLEKLNLWWFPWDRFTLYKGSPSGDFIVNLYNAYDSYKNVTNTQAGAIYYTKDYDPIQIMESCGKL